MSRSPLKEMYDTNEVLSTPKSHRQRKPIILRVKKILSLEKYDDEEDFVFQDKTPNTGSNKKKFREYTVDKPTIKNIGLSPNLKKHKRKIQDCEDEDNNVNFSSKEISFKLTPCSVLLRRTSTAEISECLTPSRKRQRRLQSILQEEILPRQILGNLSPISEEKTPTKSRKSQEFFEETLQKKRYHLRAPTPLKDRSDLRRTPHKYSYKEIDEVSDISDDEEFDEYKPKEFESSFEDEERSNIKKTVSTKKKKKVVIKSRNKEMIPRIEKRKKILSSPTVGLQEAQLRLHISSIPECLPCRENEFAEIYEFTRGKISEGSGGCMYISGVPGTGKTVTVKETIRSLQSDSDVSNFKFVEINGMRLTDPSQAYVQLWKSLYPNHGRVTSEHACSLLTKTFSEVKDQTIVLLVDELDMLCTTRRQNVLYNLFEWPNTPGSKLIVLAIANTMDLPERVMMNRVSSRLGLTRLTFYPYTHHQLQEIVSARLEGLDVFDKDAVQLVSRKVASLSGDARRALDICRRATEIAEREGSNSIALDHVSKAHSEMFSSPKISAIQSCSSIERIFLQSIVSEFHRTGIEETSLGSILSSLNTLLHYGGFDPLNTSECFQLLYRLSTFKLLLGEHSSKGLDLRIRLNVSVDDVLFALNKI